MNKVMGQFNSAGYLGFIISFGLSGFLVPEANQTNISTALIATIIAVGLGFLVTLTLKPGKGDDGASQEKPSPVTLLKDGITLLRHNRALQSLMLLSILTIAFWDYLITLYQPYFQQIQVPDGFFGPTLALASLMAFLASRTIHKLERRIGPRWSLLVATLGPGVLYLIMFINCIPWVGVLAVVLFRGFNAMKHPLFADYNNRQIASHNRATVLSIISMITSGYTAAMGLVIGAIADRWLMGAFLFCSILVTLAAISMRVDEKVINNDH